MSPAIIALLLVTLVTTANSFTLAKRINVLILGVSRVLHQVTHQGNALRCTSSLKECRLQVYNSGMADQVLRHREPDYMVYPGKMFELNAFGEA